MCCGEGFTSSASCCCALFCAGRQAQYISRVSELAAAASKAHSLQLVAEGEVERLTGLLNAANDSLDALR